MVALLCSGGVFIKVMRHFMNHILLIHLELHLKVLYVKLSQQNAPYLLFLYQVYIIHTYIQIQIKCESVHSGQHGGFVKVDPPYVDIKVH